MPTLFSPKFFLANGSFRLPRTCTFILGCAIGFSKKSRLTRGSPLKIPGIEPSHTCKCETSDRNVFGGRIELDGRGDRRCGDPRDREYCDRDGGLEPKTIIVF